MNKRQQLEHNILNDLFFGAKEYGNGPEYKQKVKQYFEDLFNQAEHKGRIEWDDGTVIECTSKLIRHFAKRYCG